MPRYNESSSDQEDRLKNEVYSHLKEDYFRKKFNLESPEVQAIKAKAQYDASQFETRYTLQQKQKISQLKAAQQALNNNNSFSPEEKAAAQRGIDLQIMGIKPTDLPKLSPYPDGQQIGQSWVDQDTGALIGRNADGGIRQLQRWDQSPKGTELKHKQDFESRTIEMRMKLAADIIKEADPVTGEIKSRHRSIDEIDDIMNNAMGLRPKTDEEAVRRAEIAKMRRDAGLSEIPQDVQKINEEARTHGTKFLESAADSSKQQQIQQPQPKVLKISGDSAEEDYKKLPSGSVFFGPDGKRYRKP